jgi:hypothetical protein
MCLASSSDQTTVMFCNAGYTKCFRRQISFSCYVIQLKRFPRLNIKRKRFTQARGDFASPSQTSRRSRSGFWSEIRSLHTSVHMIKRKLGISADKVTLRPFQNIMASRCLNIRYMQQCAKTTQPITIPQLEIPASRSDPIPLVPRV